MSYIVQERRPGDGWDSPIPPPPYVFEGTNKRLAVLMDTPGLKQERILPSNSGASHAPLLSALLL